MENRPKGINFSEFLDAVLNTVYNKDPKKRLNFVFQIYDVDSDGLISSTDLLAINESVVEHSSLGQELKLILNHIVEQQIKQTKVL